MGGQQRLRARTRWLVTLQNHMRVGTTESKRIHADSQCALVFQLAVLADDIEIPLVELDERVERLDADCRGHLAVSQAVQRLDQAGHTGGRLEVAHIAFDRTDR